MPKTKHSFATGDFILARKRFKSAFRMGEIVWFDLAPLGKGGCSAQIVGIAFQAHGKVVYDLDLIDADGNVYGEPLCNVDSVFVNRIH